MSRVFESKPAEIETLPLLLGVAGPTGSGKTYSALRLATGMQRVTGGSIGLADTEAKRATAYARYFKFLHLDFAPPFGPLDYRGAIAHLLDKGCRNIIVDSMTHEHSGPGGVMDQINTFLDEKCGDDYGKRDRMNMIAHKQPKADRKELNNFIIQAGRGGVNFILCYRADEKVKPVQGQGIQNMGMSPETTSKLVYEMMAMFLLSAAADGKPIANPQTPLEKMFTKLPVQFRDMLAAGEPLSEDLGEKLAVWAKGGASTPPPPKPEEKPRALDELKAAGDSISLDGADKLKAWWQKSLTETERKSLGGHTGPAMTAWKDVASKVPTKDA